MNDGNQKILSNGLINFEKNRMIFNVINSMRQFQRDKYPIVPEESIKISSILTGAKSISLFQYCQSPPCLREDQLMLLSRTVEPPEAKPIGGDAPTVALTPTSIVSATGTLRGFRSVMMSSPSIASAPSPLGNFEQGTVGKARLAPALLQILADQATANVAIASAAQQAAPVPTTTGYVEVRSTNPASISNSTTKQLSTSTGALRAPTQAVAEEEESGELDTLMSPTTISNRSMSNLETNQSLSSPAPTITSEFSNVQPASSLDQSSRKGSSSTSKRDSTKLEPNSANHRTSRLSTGPYLHSRNSLLTIDPFDNANASATVATTGMVKSMSLGLRPVQVANRRTSMISIEAIEATLAVNLINATPQGSVRVKPSSTSGDELPKTPITFEDVWESVIEASGRDHAEHHHAANIKQSASRQSIRSIQQQLAELNESDDDEDENDGLSLI